MLTSPNATFGERDNSLIMFHSREDTIILGIGPKLSG
jgi:hypothetical protein